MFVEDFARELERYCDEVLACVRRDHGQPTDLVISWNPEDGLWARALQLGWSARVAGKWHTHAWGDSLPLEALGPAGNVVELRRRHKDADGFFKEGKRDALKSRTDEDEIEPPAEYGRWLAMIFDETMLEVEARVAQKPAFKGVKLDISGHDGDGPYGAKTHLGDLAELRQDGSYMPSREFLDGLFRMCTNDGARIERWLSLAELGAAPAPRPAGLPKWKTFEMFRLTKGNEPSRWLIEVHGTTFWERLGGHGSAPDSSCKYEHGSLTEMYAKASVLIAQRKREGFHEYSKQAQPRLEASSHGWSSSCNRARPCWAWTRTRYLRPGTLAATSPERSSRASCSPSLAMRVFATTSGSYRTGLRLTIGKGSAAAA
jgi:hypothetical protein